MMTVSPSLTGQEQLQTCRCGVYARKLSESEAESTCLRRVEVSFASSVAWRYCFLNRCFAMDGRPRKLTSKTRCVTRKGLISSGYGRERLDDVTQHAGSGGGEKIYRLCSLRYEFSSGYVDGGFA